VTLLANRGVRIGDLGVGLSVGPAGRNFQYI